MNLRSGDSWITLHDIKAYMELYSARHPEDFPRLMLSAQRAHVRAKAAAKQKLQAAQERANALKRER